MAALPVFGLRRVNVKLILPVLHHEQLIIEQIERSVKTAYLFLVLRIGGELKNLWSLIPSRL